jgi:acetoin utilization deacetylase AcuC-like enzyme
VTGVYTDERCLAHGVPGHPERPERLAAAVAGLSDSALPLSWHPVPAIDEQALRLVHSSPQITLVQEAAARGGGWIDPDTFVVGPSLDAALLAAGAATQAVQDVVAGREREALVLVRPPGHHATASRSMGFCLFNNAALAAAVALEEGAVGRTAIVDIDVHHGNGTQDIFYSDPRVMYCSTHQYPFYPGTGGLDERGVGAGEGTTINLPLPAGCGDDVYRRVTDRVVVPALDRFEPECLIISLGLDAHWRDPLAGMRLSIDGYLGVVERLLHASQRLCRGKVVVLLEGGYDLEVLENGVGSVARLLAGLPREQDALGKPAAGPPEPNVEDLISAVATVHGLG